jgi:hypothetical protein
LSGLHHLRSLLQAEPETLSLGLEPELVVKTVGAVSNVALVRKKLDLVAPKLAGIAQRTLHYACRESLAPVFRYDGDCLDKSRAMRSAD